jgi:HEAT repeat protein
MMHSYRKLVAAILLAAARSVVADVPPIPYLTPVPTVEPRVVVDPRTIELLAAALASETDVPRKALLLADLGRCPLPAVEAAIAGAFSDGNALVRAAAVRAAIDHSPELAKQAVSKVTADPSPEVRGEIARLAGKVGDDATIAKLISDADPRVCAADGG